MCDKRMVKHASANLWFHRLVIALLVLQMPLAVAGQCEDMKVPLPMLPGWHAPQDLDQALDCHGTQHGQDAVARVFEPNDCCQGGCACPALGTVAILDDTPIRVVSISHTAPEELAPSRVIIFPATASRPPITRL